MFKSWAKMQESRGFNKNLLSSVFPSFDPDLILQVVKCADVHEREPRPKTPATRMLSGPIRQEPV